MTTFFKVISSNFDISTIQNTAGTTAQAISFRPFFHHSLNIFSTFFGFQPSFQLSHFQIYNYNCTIPILQLQITFYSCRNCHQLHVKICSALLQLATAQANSVQGMFCHLSKACIKVQTWRCYVLPPSHLSKVRVNFKLNSNTRCI